MNTDQIEVRPDVRLATVLGYLRLLKTLPVQTDKLMVVDRKGIFQGVLRAQHAGNRLAGAQGRGGDGQRMPSVQVDMPGGRSGAPVPGSRPAFGASG